MTSACSPTTCRWMRTRGGGTTPHWVGCWVLRAVPLVSASRTWGGWRRWRVWTSRPWPGGWRGYFEAAIAAGADAFSTGEISEPQAHYAREMGVAFLAAGHHATERYGAPALAGEVARQLGVSHQFIDIDNPA